MIGAARQLDAGVACVRRTLTWFEGVSQPAGCIALHRRGDNLARAVARVVVDDQDFPFEAAALLLEQPVDQQRELCRAIAGRDDDGKLRRGEHAAVDRGWCPIRRETLARVDTPRTLLARANASTNPSAGPAPRHPERVDGEEVLEGRPHQEPDSYDQDDAADDHRRAEPPAEERDRVQGFDEYRCEGHQRGRPGHRSDGDAPIDERIRIGDVILDAVQQQAEVIRGNPLDARPRQLREAGGEEHEGERDQYELHRPAVLAARRRAPCPAGGAPRGIERKRVAAARKRQDPEGEDQHGVEVVGLAEIVRQPEQVGTQHRGRRGAERRQQTDRRRRERQLPDEFERLDDWSREHRNLETVEQPDRLPQRRRDLAPHREMLRRVKHRQGAEEHQT